MMGMTMPTQSSLSDLSTLLQLLQAASDPKTAKATIETISQARAAYDDAIAESVKREQAALATLKRVEAADLKAQKAADKAEKSLDELQAKEADLKEAIESLAQDQRLFDAYKAEIAKQALDNAALAAEQDAKVQASVAEMTARAKVLEAKSLKLDASIESTEAVRADYEAKLAKFKALTE